jgi:hypothetical protein
MLPEGATAGLLGFQPQIIDTMNAISEQMKLIHDEYHLKVNWAMEGNAPSGFSLLVQNMDLMEQREDDVKLAKMQEKKIYKVLRALQEYHLDEIKQVTKDEPILPDGNLFVNFADIEFPINRAEEREDLDWELKHNHINHYDIMRRKQPDLTDEECAKIITENKKINGNFTRGDLFREAIETEEVEE